MSSITITVKIGKYNNISTYVCIHHIYRFINIQSILFKKNHKIFENKFYYTPHTRDFIRVPTNFIWNFYANGQGIRGENERDKLIEYK